MVIIAADDERLALEGLISSINKALPGAQVHGFRSSGEALDFARKNRCDLAFLDIEMPGINGLQMARALKETNPKVNLLFVTGYTEYAMDAFELQATAYIHKPVTVEAIRKELGALRFPVEEVQPKPLRVRTFGNFEVYCGETPLHFQYSKTKELFAYLIDRKGSMCNINEAAGVLWPEDDQGHTSYLKNLRTDLMQVLREHGYEDALIRQRGCIGIALDKVECDYYVFLGDYPKHKYLYQGEYMSQYSWAEFTNATLQNMHGT